MTPSAAVAWAHGRPDGGALSPEAQAFLAEGPSEPFSPGVLNNPERNRLMRRA